MSQVERGQSKRTDGVSVNIAIGAVTQTAQCGLLERRSNWRKLAIVLLNSSHEMARGGRHLPGWASVIAAFGFAFVVLDRCVFRFSSWLSRRGSERFDWPSLWLLVKLKPERALGRAVAGRCGSITDIFYSELAGGNEIGRRSSGGRWLSG
jgi:hypothetical protein